MADRPILFSGPMVRALLEGRKTQTRRVLNPQPNRMNGGHPLYDGYGSYSCERGWKRLLFAKGDRLWVRETWAPKTDGFLYGADWLPDAYDGLKPWRPGIHMARVASRLTLNVTDVRVQRVQDISDRGASNDCTAEGVFHTGQRLPSDWLERGFRSIERAAFSDLWDSLNASRGYGWDANPWVVALTFTVDRRNIDSPPPGGTT
jgi:hypothetical protein